MDQQFRIIVVCSLWVILARKIGNNHVFMTIMINVRNVSYLMNHFTYWYHPSRAVEIPVCQININDFFIELNIILSWSTTGNLMCFVASIKIMLVWRCWKVWIRRVFYFKLIGRWSSSQKNIGNLSDNGSVRTGFRICVSNWSSISFDNSQARPVMAYLLRDQIEFFHFVGG